MTVSNQLRYGNQVLEYIVERRARRTLGISVEPSGQVIVVAPPSATAADISARVHKRARWILAQKRDFAQYIPRTPDRRYVPGETHLYLGRQFRLAVHPEMPKKVLMTRGTITVGGVGRDDSQLIERLVLDWYREKATTQFIKRIATNRERFAEPDRFVPTSLRLQRMKSRWGSMSPGGRLLLNPDLVRAPIDSIDYVITHELCHLAVLGHSRDFYELQSRVLPDWSQRKQRLERLLA
jgi:predicted metal-dependent hydrolase